MKAIVTVGIPTSGKSTFAEDWVSESPKNRWEVNRDNIRHDLMEQDGKDFSWKGWNWKREKEVSVIVDEMIFECYGNDMDIIISDTNLDIKRRDVLVDNLEFVGYEVEIMNFSVSIEEAWRRDAARANGVGASVIAKHYEKWLAQQERKRISDVVINESMPSCILVDIDGTLAHMEGVRGAFEWDKVGLDAPDEAVISVVSSMHSAGVHVIIMSGRDGCCENATRDWLKTHNIPYDRFFIRQTGDMRKDTIIKEEIFWREIAGNYDVKFVVDDRPSVCRMWRDIGLKVFQVGNPHCEF